MAKVDSVNGHDANDGNPYVPTVTIAGKVGNAVQFNGVDVAGGESHVLIPHTADFSQAQVTVTCWIKLITKGTTILFFGKHNDYSLSYNSGTDRINGKIGTQPVSADSFGSPPLDTWLFVVLKNDSSGVNSLSIQINNGVVDSSFRGELPAGTDDLIIGNASTPAYMIDDLRFFPDLLTSGEIDALWNSGAGSASAIGDEIHWWTFDALVGGVYPDSAGSADGTPNSPGVQSVAGKISNAISVTQIDLRNWLVVLDSPDLQAYDKTSFSFVFWLKVLGYPSSRSSILFKTDAGDSNYQIDLYSDGTLGFYLAGSDFAYPEADVAAIPLNEWMMITATYENGVGLSLQKNLDAPVQFAYLLDNMPLNSPEDLIYGRQLNGAIDELYFCKHVLTSDEISYFYNSGAGRSLYP